MTDDIDHLGSRRVRTVGELLANQCRVGLARTGAPRPRTHDALDAGVDQITPQKLINPKSLSAVVRDFFGRSQPARSSWIRRTRFRSRRTSGGSRRLDRED